MFYYVYLETDIIITYGIGLSITIWKFGEKIFKFFRKKEEYRLKKSFVLPFSPKGMFSLPDPYRCVEGLYRGVPRKFRPKSSLNATETHARIDPKGKGWSKMAMSVIWTAMVVISIVCGLATGRGPAVAAAAMEGAAAAVELCLSMAGVLCLWMGVMEVMQRSGLSELLSKALRPVLRRLYPAFAKDRAVMDSISANVSANLLGLGNAATPLGIQAARQMSHKTPGVASDALCMLVVCNTASIQLIPTTVASVRMAAGCAAPFDILPAVWLASGISVTVGIIAAKIFACFWPMPARLGERGSTA